MTILKKFLIVLLFLIVLSSTFLPLQKAEAFELPNPFLMVAAATPFGPTLLMAEYITSFLAEDGGSDDPGWIEKSIVGGATNIISAISSSIINLGKGLLDYTLSPEFISASGSGNPIVEKGWDILRSLANSALIIGLVIIAINIILGREEGQAKKTLVNFVVVALLINFTPLICGFFIEGANILARGFISGGINMQEIGTPSFENFTQVISFTFLYLIFAIMSFVVYVLYAMLFLMRVIILWILIIASPIALATKVFPKSEAVMKFFPSILHWDEWYKTFLQWTIIIIPASLFIFLSNELMQNISIVSFETSGQDAVGWMISILIAMSLPFIFLLAGFMITISSGGSVAAPINTLGKKAWAATAGAAGGYALGKAKSGAKATGAWAKEGAIGAGAATMKGENPLNKANRDSGRASVDKVKSSIGGAMTGAKDYVGIGESNTWAKRSAETEKQLAEGMDNYFDGSSGEENVAKFNQAQQQLEKLRLSKSLSKAELSKRHENLFVAAANSGDIEDSAIENFLSKSKEKGVDVDYGKMLSGTSAVDIMKKYKPKALERSFIAEKLVGTKQGEYILNDSRATQAHSAALSRGIETLDTAEQSEAATSIGAPSSPGDAANLARQGMAKRADELEKKSAKKRTKEEEEEMQDLAEKLS